MGYSNPTVVGCVALRVALLLAKDLSLTPSVIMQYQVNELINHFAQHAFAFCLVGG